MASPLALAVLIPHSMQARKSMSTPSIRCSFSYSSLWIQSFKITLRDNWVTGPSNSPMPTSFTVAALCLFLFPFLFPLDIPLGQVGVMNAFVIHIVKGDVGIEVMRLCLLFVFGLQPRQLLRILLCQIDTL